MGASMYLDEGVHCLARALERAHVALSCLRSPAAAASAKAATGARDVLTDIAADLAESIAWLRAAVTYAQPGMPS